MDQPKQEPVSKLDAFTQEQATDSNAINIPEISLPKGGGALKGIDEKFQVNAANGTAGFSMPLPLSPSRNGFAPSLALSYNSGQGNGLFGLGWGINLPSIQRKTDQQLPSYSSNPKEDVFVFAGAEDLVPMLEAKNNQWLAKEHQTDNYKIKRYRPRIEGAFMRIEKIQHPDHGTYWKVCTKDNVVTIFGRHSDARIADPNNPSRIFKWLPELSYDNKGNCLQFFYKKEDLDNVPNVVHEKNRQNGLAAFTNTYLKTVKYGNLSPYYANPTNPYDPQSPTTDYCFELVVDFGEHDPLIPTPDMPNLWTYRQDAFSSYRAGFEIRTHRLCQRILLFHHFEAEQQFVGTEEVENFGKDYLVRSLDMAYAPSSINDSGQAEVTYLSSITQAGYIRKPGGNYSKKTLPPLEFSYQQLTWSKEVKNVRADQIVHAPSGLTNNYQWVDLYSEGIAGILTEQAEGWFYKSNKGADATGQAMFAPAQKVLSKPSFNGLGTPTLSIRSLAADGQKQAVVYQNGISGYFELERAGEWQALKTFEQRANVDVLDPNTRLIDLTGNGQPDIVLTEEHAFKWFASKGKLGNEAAQSIPKTHDEEQGPAIVFADQLQTIFLADMSGDGLTDIVRIRNREVCYWANLGYGRFSAKITMSNAPVFDYPDTFNPSYIHLADISGTGTTDIIYLGENSFKAFINLSGNAWSDAHSIEPSFPVDRNAKLSVVDLLGTGTACIVWSSDLPAHANAPMRYIDLMSSKKPHILIHYKNNLGKENSIVYKSSTYYYLKDKQEGNPWITKLPFPVQLVSKSIVEEKITGVRFTSEYEYHHGYYDYVEREFRGFGLVEQLDSEDYETWKENNLNNQLDSSESLFQAPKLTKTWFHTGAFLERQTILRQYEQDYWYAVYNRRFPNAPLTVEEPQLSDAVLSDAVKALRGDEFREVLRACKGRMLRQEVFVLDAPEYPTLAELQLQLKPYIVTTGNYQIELLQPRTDNPYAVFLGTEKEAISLHYERNESDPRIAHTINTKVDELGNVLEKASVVYGRKASQAAADFLDLSSQVTDFAQEVLAGNAVEQTKLQAAFTANINATHAAQLATHVVYTKVNFAEYKDGMTNLADIDLPATYRLRLPYETKTFELTGLIPAQSIFQPEELEHALDLATEIAYHETATLGLQARLMEHVKTKYLDDDLTPLDFGYFASVGLAYENYQLAYTPDLIQDIYQDQGGVALEAEGVEVVNFLQAEGNYSLVDGNLWIRSGITHFKEPDESLAAVQARFFAPIAFEDPSGNKTRVIYDTETFTGNTRNNDGYYLYIQASIDPVDNKSQVAQFNYRTLTPSRIIDVNANPTTVLLDELGLVKAVAIEGNGVFNDATRTNITLLQAADNLNGLKEYTEVAETNTIAQLFASATTQSTDTTTLKQLANQLLAGATNRFIYDFDVYKNTGTQPTVIASFAREEHVADNPNSNIQIGFEYSSGMGNVVLAKAQAESGLAYYMESGVRKEKDTGTDLRWIGNGRVVLNNKGNPVKQYEPYFSTNFLYEAAPELTEIGVTPVIYYDAMGRATKTLYPDGTLAKVSFDAWKQHSFDQNDTILESDWYHNRMNHLIDADLIAQGKDPIKEKQAAQQAALHANTPSAVYTDSLGRTILHLENNGKDAAQKYRYYTTFIHLDIEGNAKTVKDARGNTVMAYQYDILGHRLYQNSMDAGERWMVKDSTNKPLYRWNSRNHLVQYIYDAAQRPSQVKVTGGDGLAPLNHIYERVFYGEGQANDYEYNLRGQAIQQYDTAGKVVNRRFDFKGNLLESTRQVLADYKNIPNWTNGAIQDPTLFDPDLSLYTTSASFDALNRTVETITPDGSRTKPMYNEAGLLEQVKVTQTAVAEKLFVKDINYNSKGQRERIVYGDTNGQNLAITSYQYDLETFRLLQLKTIRNNGEILQELHYTYDPVGNITTVEDKAIPVNFFNNQTIKGLATYAYDAVYRLKEAKGREHAGQAINFGQCDNWKDLSFLKTYSANDNLSWRNYTQTYQYDPVGNILQNKHHATNGNWTRDYAYEALNNRLYETTIGGQSYLYPHHATHGFITALPHLSLMQWNFKDQLQAVAKQVVCHSNATPETTYYVYDGQGQRIRKVTETYGGGGKKEERLYLNGVEIYKKHSGTHSGLERTTLHVMDDSSRIAMVDTRNNVDDGTDIRTVRFQFNNHLDSASLELNDSGQIISYEEYHPYGTTAYQAASNVIKAAAKRYRYTGMERDEESGMAYHSARYYLPWLCRWLSSDPIGIRDGVNTYQYAHSRVLVGNDKNGKLFWFVVAAIAIGTVVAVGMEIGTQVYRHGRVKSWTRVFFAGVGGAASGLVAGLTGGQSLWWQLAGVAGGSILGGTVTRSLNGQRTTLGDVFWDAAIGLALFGVFKGVGAGVRHVRGGSSSPGSGAGGAAAGDAAAAGAPRSGGAAVNSRTSRAGAAGEPNTAGRSPRGPGLRGQERAPKPEIPEGMTLGQFGKEIGWGSKLSPEAGREAARSSGLETFRRLGITPERAREWIAFYRDVARLTPQNPTARGRVAFFEEFLRMHNQSLANNAAAGGTAAAGGQIPRPNEDESTTRPTSPAPTNAPAGGTTASPNLGGSPLMLRRSILLGGSSGADSQGSFVLDNIIIHTAPTNSNYQCDDQGNCQYYQLELRFGR